MGKSQAQVQRAKQEHETSREQQDEAARSTLDDAAVASASAGRDKRTQDLLDDDILADIDALLEENAQEFVAGYVQKGGQ